MASITQSANQSKPLKPLNAICYIDGFNLYYGLKEAGYRRYYWLNPVALAQELIPPDHILVSTKYFTAPVRGGSASDPQGRANARDASRRRQGRYLDALETLQGIERFDGHYLMKSVKCPHCNKRFGRDEEKMTDVQIATEMLSDAFQKSFDTAIVISADSDLVPPVRQIKNLDSSKRIDVVFPPKRKSYELTQAADNVKRIWRRALAKCQLPDPVVSGDGCDINRPNSWQ